MHGRLKVKTTAEQQEEKRKEREKKAKLFTEGMSQVFKNRGDTERNEINLTLTGKLLSGNPDVYTLWNVRKEIFINMQESRENIDELLHKELEFLQNCLHVSPKSYGNWNQRCFVMKSMKQPDWTDELRLCNLFLKYDARNFHCWDYRRFVVRESKISAGDELEFTAEKISENFSNYSAWHNRSKLLPLIYPDSTQSGKVAEEALLKEFEMVQNAFFTDPNDQSAWFYQRWLLGRKEHKAKLLSLSLHLKSSLLIASFSQPVNLSALSSTSITINDKQQELCWKASTTNNNVKYHCVWVTNYSSTEETLNVKVSFLEIDNCLPSYQLVLQKGNPSAHLRWTTDKLSLEESSFMFSDNHTEAKSFVLDGELEACKILLEEELDNKWTMLTIIYLMCAINSVQYISETEELFCKLIKTDPMRCGYYNDLRSKYCVENELQKLIEEKNNLEDINLSGKELTTFNYGQYFTSCQKLDLRDNLLTNYSFVDSLVGVEELLLDNPDVNRIASTFLEKMKL